MAANSKGPSVVTLSSGKIADCNVDEFSPVDFPTLSEEDIIQIAKAIGSSKKLTKFTFESLFKYILY
jgi:hypothetical protein